MTAKRFTVDEDGYFDKINHRYVTIDYLMDLVNMLDEENTMLKLQVETKLFSRRELEKENEQLKSEYKVLHTQYQDLKKFVKNNFDEYLTQEKLNRQIIKLSDENEQLKNKIDVLEDDNETYHKSLEKLNLYTKRFIPTKCTNEFKDCKTNRYYWLDHEGNFEGCLELLNLLDCERELLKSENSHLKAKLMEYEEQIKGDVE